MNGEHRLGNGRLVHGDEAANRLHDDSGGAIALFDDLPEHGSRPGSLLCGKPLQREGGGIASGRAGERQQRLRGPRIVDALQRIRDGPPAGHRLT
jgi:hypothetical protein